MKRTKVFNDSQLAEAIGGSRVGDKFYVNGNRSEQNRVYQCAGFIGRKLAMRKFREGWKATVIE